MELHGAAYMSNTFKDKQQDVSLGNCINVTDERKTYENKRNKYVNTQLVCVVTLPTSSWLLLQSMEFKLTASLSQKAAARIINAGRCKRIKLCPSRKQVAAVFYVRTFKSLFKTYKICGLIVRALKGRICIRITAFAGSSNFIAWKSDRSWRVSCWWEKSRTEGFRVERLWVFRGKWVNYHGFARQVVQTLRQCSSQKENSTRELIGMKC